MGWAQGGARAAFATPSWGPSQQQFIQAFQNLSHGLFFFRFTKKKKEPREGPFPKKEKILSGFRNLNPIRRGAMMEIDRIYLSTIPTFTNITKVQRDFKTFL